EFVSLEPAFKSRTRRVDASVIATGDIQTSTGEFVARAGDRVNPLDTRAFTQAIVIFDATSKKQVEKVQKNIDEIRAKPGVQKVVYITTKLDAERGWDAYKDITEKFEAPVFVLTPDVRERFALEYVPSVITADSTHFIIDELGLDGDDKAQRPVRTEV